MKATVGITLKAGVFDPQGTAIGQALQSLGFSGVKNVRQGKHIELDLEGDDACEAAIRRMCERLLANPTIEDYAIDIQS